MSCRDHIAGTMSTLALRARTMMRSPAVARSRMMSGHSLEEAIGAQAPSRHLPSAHPTNWRSLAPPPSPVRAPPDPFSTPAETDKWKKISFVFLGGIVVPYTLFTMVRHFQHHHEWHQVEYPYIGRRLKAPLRPSKALGPSLAGHGEPMAPPLAHLTAGDRCSVLPLGRRCRGRSRVAPSAPSSTTTVPPRRRRPRRRSRRLKPLPRGATHHSIRQAGRIRTTAAPRTLEDAHLMS